MEKGRKDNSFVKKEKNWFKAQANFETTLVTFETTFFMSNSLNYCQEVRLFYDVFW